MIGSALKKLAAENGLTISGGIAYGNYQGYAITLSEGAGYKLLTVSTHLTDTACNWLNSQLSGHNLMKEFRVEDVQLSETGAVIVFNDNPGTMKRFHEFLQWFFPLLPQAGATGYDCCCSCGQPFNGDETWKMAGNTPMHLHPGCAQSLLRDVQQEEEAEQKTGSYGKGLIGALLGGVLGAVLWALVLYLGYIAAVAGLVIGLLAELLYRAFGGKNGKGKIPILILGVVVGVVLGTFASDAFTLASMISNNEIALSFSEIVPYIFYLLGESTEYFDATMANLVEGLLFALIGMAGMLYRTYKETKKFKMKDMK